MAKFDGKQIVGLIGGLVFKKGRNNTTIVQPKPASMAQTTATKGAANLFGIASTLSKTIRYGMTEITDQFYDGGMVNRLTNQNRSILAHCYDKDTRKFVFNETSFSRLAGFEFNFKSPVTNSLWVQPQTTLSGNDLTVYVPAFEIPVQLKFPNLANTCTINISVNLYVLDQSLKRVLPLQSIEIGKNQTHVPAQEFKFEVPDGCLCVAGINLQYFYLYNGIKTVLNKKDFNPAAICGAILSPGIFVPPVQTDPYRAVAKWRIMDGLEIPY
ncbi:hypothetical protein [Pedobacter foliorum]|uniref:hypothetical protein n=1 Tax=Pedobacter foliorum TaxID=2739058 RepID=UPI0015659A8C|nr:hypothetical protein [Pedobacter foliorum]NRF40302.1 hypothetical protein [Pedobacter foliorum]